MTLEERIDDAERKNRLHFAESLFYGMLIQDVVEDMFTASEFSASKEMEFKNGKTDTYSRYDTGLNSGDAVCLLWKTLCAYKFFESACLPKRDARDVVISYSREVYDKALVYLHQMIVYFCMENPPEEPVSWEYIDAEAEKYGVKNPRECDTMFGENDEDDPNTAYIIRLRNKRGKMVRSCNLFNWDIMLRDKLHLSSAIQTSLISRNDPSPYAKNLLSRADKMYGIDNFNKTNIEDLPDEIFDTGIVKELLAAELHYAAGVMGDKAEKIIQEKGGSLEVHSGYDYHETLAPLVEPSFIYDSGRIEYCRVMNEMISKGSPYSKFWEENL